MPSTQLAEPAIAARRPRLGLVLTGAIVTVLAALVVVLARDWLSTTPSEIPGIPGPGTLVSDGSPVLRLLTTVAGIITLSALLGAIVLSSSDRRGVVSPMGRRFLLVAAGSGTVWAVVSLLQAAWAFADVLGVPLSEALRPAVVATYAGDVPQVRALLIMSAIAIAIAMTAALSTTVVAAGVAAALAIAAMCLPTLSGHGGGSSQHALSLLSGTAHAASSAVWIASALAIIAFACTRRGSLVDGLARLSRLTMAAVVVVAISGIGNAFAQMNTPAELVSTRYGNLVILKAALLIAASVLGFLARRRVLSGVRIVGRVGRAAFVKLMGVETAVLAIAAGLGVALATSPRPKAEVQFATVGESLAGFAFPPPPTVQSVALTIQPDPVFLAVCAVLAIGYIAGVVRLLRRGDRWPWGRTIAWMLGVLALLWCTNAGISQYANITPGLHMAQHMALTMLVPILLVLGGPATLALRAIRPSTGPQWGPREWIVYALHSRAAVILTNPLVVLAIYFVGLYGLYLSTLFGTLMGSHVGHVAMQAHFIISGYLFYWVLIGVDPRPRFLPYWQRFLILVMSSAFHGFFAVVIMMSEAPIAVDWFTSVQPPWMTDLSVDTVSGGQAAWAIGEFPILIVAIALCIQWARSDERDAKRLDRQADRDGDKALSAYNEYLARLGKGRPPNEVDR